MDAAKVIVDAIRRTPSRPSLFNHVKVMKAPET